VAGAGENENPAEGDAADGAGGRGHGELLRRCSGAERERLR
jgi:hypothetical protein